MKKTITIVSIILMILGVVTVVLSLLSKLSAPSAPSAVIGGADGPTVIFLASYLGSGSIIIGIVGGSLLLIIGIVLLIGEALSLRK